MHRRRYLGLCGIALVAGCGGESGGGGTTHSGGSSGDGGATPPDTATTTPDPTPEPTPTPKQTTHSVGETFVVGEGQAAEYTVTSVSTTDRIGGEYGVAADGVFVVVELEITNRASESFTISSNLFTLVDGQDREFDVDTDGASYAEESIIFEQLNPDVTTSGVIVFDVPADQESRSLRITPASILSTAQPHTVEL